MANQLFAKKSLEVLLKEMQGDNRLRRALGPVTLTSLGVGAIIGAGIFVLTGRAAAQDAGPAIILSYVVAGLGCALAAMCYAELASMVPVAGSAYTYTYATLGEIFAWIIGWDLILEYAMGCATVASGWSGYFDKFLKSVFHIQFPARFLTDPFSTVTLDDGTQVAGLFNLPAVLIMALVTYILVVGIRESAVTNTVLVMVKLAVVLFVILVGISYVNGENWRSLPVSERLMPEDGLIPGFVAQAVKDTEHLEGEAAKDRIEIISKQVLAMARIERERDESSRLQRNGKITQDAANARVEAAESRHGAAVPRTNADRAIAENVLAKVRDASKSKRTEKWGVLALVGLDRWLIPIDDHFRSPFAPYGFSGIMLGAAIVFFAYIGFDSISTHSEEAIRPQRDVPIGIIASLTICTVLYIAVSAVITGMVPYPKIDEKAAVAAAFLDLANQQQSGYLRAATALISTGAIAGLTSVLLVTFLSQARIFLAMARDGLMSPNIFGAVHPKYRTPHKSTILTGVLVMIVAALTPIGDLEQMVNIGTLMAFVMVCLAVMILRTTRPDANRPFRCPIVFVLAPLGIFVNFSMTLFLTWQTWVRLVGWLVIGLIIYFAYGQRHSKIALALEQEIAKPGLPSTGTRLDEMHQP